MFVGISPLERYSLYRDMSPFPFLLPFVGIPSKKTVCLIPFFPEMLLIQDSLLRELSYESCMFHTSFFFFPPQYRFSLIPRPSFFFPERINRDRSFLQVSCLALWSVRLSPGEYCRPCTDRVMAVLQKGGVPAAPSGTATLLRLSPSHRFYPRSLLIGYDLQVPPAPMA